MKELNKNQKHLSELLYMYLAEFPDAEVEIVKMFIKNGADVNYRSDYVPRKELLKRSIKKQNPN